MTTNHSATAFRLTFNLPANTYMLRDNEALEIKVEGKGDRKEVFFRPCSTTKGNRDAVPLESRDRGGCQIVINGDDNVTLLRAFESMGMDQLHPFFTLSAMPDTDWLQLTHFTGDQAPTKAKPHVRIWTPRETAARQVKTGTLIARPDQVSKIMGPFATKVREAHMIAEGYKNSRRAGRPPGEVVAAQIFLQSFEQLAVEVLPHLGGKDTVEAMLAARRSLDVAISKLQGQNETVIASVLAASDIKMPTARATPPVISLGDGTKRKGGRQTAHA